MRSGRYITSDVLCNICHQVLGWYYEYAFDRSQKEKETKFCLELTKLRGGDEKIEENETVVEKYTNFFMASNGKLNVLRPQPQ